MAAQIPGRHNLLSPASAPPAQSLIDLLSREHAVQALIPHLQDPCGTVLVSEILMVIVNAGVNYRHNRPLPCQPPGTCLHRVNAGSGSGLHHGKVQTFRFFYVLNLRKGGQSIDQRLRHNQNGVLVGKFLDLSPRQGLRHLLKASIVLYNQLPFVIHRVKTHTQLSGSLPLVFRGIQCQVQNILDFLIIHRHTLPILLHLYL